jgi:glycosyltransferase involved in cell wall biosynthesis
MEDKTKKIIIFSTAYFPFVGGAEVAVKEVTDRILDVEFDMITARLDRKLPKFERIGNINVHRIGFGCPIIDKCYLAFCGYKIAEKLEKEKKYQAIWAIMASHGGLGALSFKKRNKNIPFLLTLQEGDDFKHINNRAFLVRNKFRDIFRQADYIQAISNYLADWGKSMGAACPIEVVPNGVDFNKFSIFNFSPPQRDPAHNEYNKVAGQFSINNFKKKLGISESEKVIITISRLVKKNGVGDLIKAMSQLRITNYELPVKLLICGIGEEEKKLKNLAKSLNIENKVLFLGHVPHNELLKYLTISDVFCRPSLSEGLGNVFLEAMATGVPVIATPVGGIPDFLFDGKTGWFCEVKNPKSISEKIKWILEEKNKNDVEKVIAVASKLVKEKYDWRKIAIRMRDIFVNL